LSETQHVVCSFPTWDPTWLQCMGRTLYPTCVKGLGNIQAIRFAAQRTMPQNLAQITLDRAPDVEAKSMLLKPIRGIMIHGILIRWQDTQRFKVVCFNLGLLLQ